MKILFEIKKTNARVLNSTEGGARIEGAEALPLSQVIRECCTRDAMVRSTLQMSVGFFFGMNQEEGKKVLDEARTILELAAGKAGEGMKQVEAMEKILASPSPLPELIREEMARFQAIHEELIQNHKVYSVLDEAADRVLHPFLQEENRPQGDVASSDNIRKSLDRYTAYFAGMNELCRHFSTVIQETMDQMQESQFGLF